MVVVAIQFSRSFKFGCFREFEVLEFGVVGGVAVGEKRSLKAWISFILAYRSFEIKLTENT